MYNLISILVFFLTVAVVLVGLWYLYFQVVFWRLYNELRFAEGKDLNYMTTKLPIAFYTIVSIVFVCSIWQKATILPYFVIPCFLVMIIQICRFNRVWEAIGQRQRQHGLRCIFNYSRKKVLLQILVLSGICLLTRFSYNFLNDYRQKNTMAYIVTGVVFETQQADYAIAGDPPMTMMVKTPGKEVFIELENGMKISVARKFGHSCQNIELNSPYEVGDTVYVFKNKVVPKP